MDGLPGNKGKIVRRYYYSRLADNENMSYRRKYNLNRYKYHYLPERTDQNRYRWVAPNVQPKVQPTCATASEESDESDVGSYKEFSEHVALRVVTSSPKPLRPVSSEKHTTEDISSRAFMGGKPTELSGAGATQEIDEMPVLYSSVSSAESTTE